ncbi:MAG: hypothetical protein SCH71_08985 [Desulfobulbaceae bacterium]|nr:hypothetical protein [Desulfobulbaceae bacterium]
MISSCPHCNKALKLGEAQQKKLQSALDALEPGKKLTIKCPACKKGITLAAGDIATENPDALRPPGPPDLTWLKEEGLNDEKNLEDIPMCLVLFPRDEKLEIVRDTLEQVGYRITVAENVEQAIESMLFNNYASIVLHSQFDGPQLENSLFHKHMRDMPMQRRRYIFYILVGPEFQTLYNLQALACSANLVVNENDLYHLGVALRKAIPQYEELFGPYMEELSSAGKS